MTKDGVRTFGRSIVGADVDIAIVLKGDILEVVNVHKELVPIDLGFVNVLPKLNVKLWPVVVRLFVTSNWKDVRLLLVIVPVQLPVHEDPDVLNETSEGRSTIKRKDVGCGTVMVSFMIYPEVAPVVESVGVIVAGMVVTVSTSTNMEVVD